MVPCGLGSASQKRYRINAERVVVISMCLLLSSHEILLSVASSTRELLRQGIGAF